MSIVRPVRPYKQLESIAFFRGCTAQELRRIDRLGTRVEVKPKRVLCKQGELGTQFFVIIRGAATVERNGARVARLRPGEAFGELSLLAGGDARRRVATVVADEPMTVLVFSRPEFSSLIHLAPTIASHMLGRVGALAMSLAPESSPRPTSGVTHVPAISGTPR